MTERETEIRERLLKASRAPWQAGGRGLRIYDHRRAIAEFLVDFYAPPGAGEAEAKANADFAAHAREDIPYLLSELSATRAAESAKAAGVERLKGALHRLEQRSIKIERSSASPDGYSFCEVCSAMAKLGEPVPHAPFCPFSVLRALAVGGAAEEGAGSGKR